jgi:C4-dicarboxylate-specific signal transduction histidine kinase
MAKSEAERPTAREGVLYFGRVAAGLSHELSNVLNIINELAGLQRDIAAAAVEAGGDARHARLADLAQRIKSQVTRGEAINRGLHRFAHTVDDACKSFDLGELLGLLAFLEERPARLARVALDVHPPEGGLALCGDPFSLLLALHACVSAALHASAEDGRVEVRAEATDEEIRVRVTATGSLPAGGADAASAAALRAGAAAWGATARLDPATDAPTSLVLSLPAAGTSQRAAGSADSSQEVP